MNQNNIKELLETIYKDCGQHLYLTGWLDEKEAVTNSFTEQYIEVLDSKKKRHTLIFIQTYSNLQAEDADLLGSIPYCLIDADVFKITVPKFGELSKTDIYNAVGYILRHILGPILIFNVYYNDEQFCLSRGCNENN